MENVTYGNHAVDVLYENTILTEKPDLVSKPPHYISSGGMETIDVIENFTEGLEGIEAVCTANALKYICRWSHKNGIQDLKKAKWYINHLIKHLNEKENN